jgi:hypothetical protein
MSMAAQSPIADGEALEREIIEELKAAKLRLRFDKVASRVVGRLKAAFASVVPEGDTVVFTITAPIRLPGKTALALEKTALGAPNAERREIVHDNEVRILRLTGTPNGAPRVLGFVHTAESDASAIIALAEARLRNPTGNA